MQQGELSDPTNKETRVIWAVCSSTGENLNWYSFRANHDLRSPESQFKGCPTGNSIVLLIYLTLQTHGHASHNHATGFGLNCKFLDWDTFLTRPKSHVCTSVSSLLERFAQHSAKDQKRNNEWVRVSEHNRPESPQNTPCITWESILLPTPDSINNQNLCLLARCGGRQWPICYPSSSLPTPTSLLSYYTGSLGGCKSWWHNYTQETSKNGLKQKIAMKPVISLHTKETIKGQWGAKSKYIPSDLFYVLSSIFPFQPPALLHICTHFHSGLGNFFP